MAEVELCHINVYCDESRHTSDPKQAYMVIGAIACPREHKREVVHRIHTLKQQYATQGEFGWKRLAPNRQAFYWAMIDVFASDPLLEFRALVVDRNSLDHAAYNAGDQELGFYKLYYQMLVHWLKPDCAYHIYLDWQQNRVQHRFADLQLILTRKLSGRARIECLEPVTSRNLPLIELTDLFIGAVGYAWNKLDGSPVKRQFCTDLAHAVGFHRLDVATVKDFPKFNIFHFQGR